jgi:hypothetical protein
MVEQGLEVEIPGAGNSVRDNGEKATTAVTQHGYQRGECFEGCEVRA